MADITFHGQSCFEIATRDARVIIDPFLTDNPVADIGPDDLLPLDAILLTHGHGDHFGDTIAVATKHQAQVIASYELANFCQHKGLSNVHPMHIGGAHDFAFGRVKMVAAIHGGGVDADETGRFTTIPCGFVVTVDNSRIYHAGDTALTMDMQLLQDAVDIMLVPIGDNFTMGIEDAARAVSFVQPKVVVPMHYGTWDIIDVDPHKFVTAVGTDAQVVVLHPGDTLPTS